jgi:hypothetical protein
LFKDGRILHHDRASRGERNGADDCDRNGDEQWARRGDHKHSQETNGFTADDPSQHSDAHRDGSVDRPQLISDPAQMWLVLLGLAHHLHDLGIARIDRPPRSGDGQSRLTIHRPRDDGGAGRLRDLKRFARKERFIHDAMAVDDRPVDRADVVRIDNKSVTHRDVIQRDISNERISFPMRDGRHAFRQSAQHRRRIAQCIIFQCLATGEHQDNDGAGEVFVEKNGSDDGNSRKEIGPEFAP